ncbi:hypothetical protein ACF0H5_016466 [Mactra antiquata]
MFTDLVCTGKNSTECEDLSCDHEKVPTCVSMSCTCRQKKTACTTLEDCNGHWETHTCNNHERHCHQGHCDCSNVNQNRSI